MKLAMQRRKRATTIAKRPVFGFGCFLLFLLGYVVNIALAAEDDKASSLQEWVTVGNNLVIATSDEKKTTIPAESISMTANGNRIAIASYHNRTGWIHIYDWSYGSNDNDNDNNNHQNWTLSATIQGSKQYWRYKKVLITNNGKRLVVGTQDSYNGIGFVQIYDWLEDKDYASTGGGTWSQTGIIDQNSNDGSMMGFGGITATSLAISDYGKHIIVGAPNRIFVYSTTSLLGGGSSSSSWQLRGAPLQNDDPVNYYLGDSVDISGDGNTIVICSRYKWSRRGNREKHTKDACFVHTWSPNQDKWQLFGNPIFGTDPLFGRSVAISRSGRTIVSVGGGAASDYSEQQKDEMNVASDLLYVFEWNEIHSDWSLKGTPPRVAILNHRILPERRLLQYTVKISSDGNRLAMGGAGVGGVQIYEWLSLSSDKDSIANPDNDSNKNWALIGSPGESPAEEEGMTMSFADETTLLTMSVEATRVAVSANGGRLITVFDNIIPNAKEAFFKMKNALLWSVPGGDKQNPWGVAAGNTKKYSSSTAGRSSTGGGDDEELTRSKKRKRPFQNFLSKFTRRNE